MSYDVQCDEDHIDGRRHSAPQGDKQSPSPFWTEIEFVEHDSTDGTMRDCREISPGAVARFYAKLKANKKAKGWKPAPEILFNVLSGCETLIREEDREQPSRIPLDDREKEKREKKKRWSREAMVALGLSDKSEEEKNAALDALAALDLTDGPKRRGLGTGINQALGRLRGASMGDAVGAGGGGNSLGIGGLGSGTGRGSGGRGGMDLGGRGKGMTRIRPGKVIFKGSLSREEIQRVIRRVMSQIKFCYERELAKEPNLQGKLVATWTIMGTGLVQKPRMSHNTMGNKNVETCVLRIIDRLRFPKPKDRGKVYVTYPFVFSSSG